MTSPKVFLREATGLVREADLLGVTILNTASSGPMGFAVAYTLYWALGSFLGADLSLGYVICGIMGFFLVMTYAFMGSAMPRSGGDYVYVSRTIHPAIGFMTGFNMAFYNIAWGLGLQGALIAQYGIGPGFYVLGHLWNLPSAIALGEWSLQPIGALIIISLVIWIFAGGLWTIGTRATIRATEICVIIGWIGWLFVLYGLLTLTPGDFVHRFNALAMAISGKSDVYQLIISTAKSYNYSVPTAYSYSPDLTLGVAGICSFALIWTMSGAYIGGEIKRAGSVYRQTIMLGLPIFLNGLLLALGTWLIIRLTGYEFLASYNFLSTQHPDALPFYVTGGGYLNLIVSLMSDNPVIATFIAISFAAWGFAICAVFMVYTRYLLAWSFDKLIPSWFANVSERFHTPVNAILTVLIISEISAILAAFYPSLVLPFSAAAAVGVAFFTWAPNAISATLFPFLKRSAPIYRASPVSRIRRPVVAGIGIVGIVFSVWIGWAFWLTLTGYMLGQIAVFAVPIAGLVLFYIAWYIRKRQGIDLRMVFAQIPPE